MKHRILELYSGIGGMHCAWNESKLEGEIVAAVDINTVANQVYLYNFPKSNLMTRNIQALSLKEINDMNVNTILMSPPCQPFTRNGKYLDENDPRTNSFLYLISLLDKFDKLQYILMENVKGFECSTVRNLFIDKLNQCQFEYQEFLLCPSNVGVPNSRLRYYCIARKTTSTWAFKRKTEIMMSLPKAYGAPDSIESILEKDVSDKYLVKNNILKRGNVLDIIQKDSKRSCCFTKAYTHYAEGTGSIYTEASPETVDECFERANKFEVGTDNFIETLKELNLRFFTPKEVLLLMSFPSSYKFPETITIKQCYRLLGNSINVKVVSELLKLLFD
ncbi:PREDICTED: tRNA (cytosine(38)-C(5))-methyltransferase [Papilio xuthus]|uniref:tRNA (cytosine(38)-C(5))-methyltransferase n=1 Tax=Papilio xuthus TaxID=66420 RepID=A0AAJ6ZHD5_PAPXU|nr:PREDICTED: tRNA (cytosine(38)-C(5))-methyltransferase [Papilio xuthus]XP_013172627.1 PREDICTED: tRNA (cytosine(38)-C(5))-methyltransferase [Papilio xuthus]